MPTSGKTSEPKPGAGEVRQCAPDEHFDAPPGRSARQHQCGLVKGLWPRLQAATKAPDICVVKKPRKSFKFEMFEC